MANVYGEDWLTNGSPPLNNEARGMIDDAVRKLTDGINAPLVGSIVAEVKFAFWVSLLAKVYDSTLWRKALYKSFQSGAGRPRSVVHGRFNMIRRFRNRVAHHEPIFHRDLAGLHDEIIEGIGWMCQDTSAWAKHHSRVAEVLNEA